MEKYSWKTARPSRTTYTPIARLNGPTQYRIMEFYTPDPQQMDLRQLAQSVIRSDVTESYLGLKRRRGDPFSKMHLI